MKKLRGILALALTLTLSAQICADSFDTERTHLTFFQLPESAAVDMPVPSDWGVSASDNKPPPSSWLAGGNKPLPFGWDAYLVTRFNLSFQGVNYNCVSKASKYDKLVGDKLIVFSGVRVTCSKDAKASD